MAKLSLVAASLLVAGSLAFIGAALRMGLADDIKATVGANDVTVYSKSTCPFCKRTKASLADLGIAAKIIELNEVDEGAEIQATLLEITGQRTVPNVFIKGQHLGGNDDMQAAIASGKLQEMLK